MDPDRWFRVRELFEAGLGVAPEERDAFLELACGGDLEVRHEVASMLRCAEESGDPLNEIVRRAASGIARSGSEPTGSAGRSRASLSFLAPPHLRRVRFWWLYASSCAAALWALACTGYWLATLGGTMTAGFTFEPGLRIRLVTSQAAQEAGVAPGDRVLALDGESVLDARSLVAALTAAGAAGDATVELERPSGERYSARLPLARCRVSSRTVIALVRGASWVLSGVVLFWFHPGRRESWAFLAATLAVGLPAILPLPDYFGGPYLPLPYPLSRGWTVAVEGFIGPAALWFFLVFPCPPAWLARRPWIVPAMFAPALAWTALFLPTYPWYPDLLQWERAALATYGGLAAMTPLAVVGAIAILVWRSRQPHPPRQAAQLRVLVLASVLSLPLPAAVYAMTHVVLGGPPGAQLDWMLLLNVPLLLFPPMVAYAIAKHALFEIDRLAARAAAYSLSVIVIGALYVGAVMLVPGVLAPRVLAESPALMALVILAAVAALRPLKEWSVGRLERWFGRPEDPETRLRSFREALRKLEGGVAPAYAQIERLVERTFRLGRVVLLLPDPGGGWVPAVAPAGFTGAVAAMHGAKELGLERLVPMLAAGELVGALGVARGRGEVTLSQADAEALELVAAEAARALARSEPGQTIGGYQVLRMIGSGGMGNVYLAVREGAGGFAKHVALKELLPEKAADLDLVRRFLLEARLVAQLQHPNIVQTYDLGETEKGYFIAMEHVAGIDVATLLRELERRRAVLPLPCAVHIVLCVCLALDRAHGATDGSGRPLGLVHRDVSPQNVLLSMQGDVKLGDFGVAQLTYGRARAGALVGKASYMAPEQIAGRPTDRRVDIFSAGVLLYELCTGSHPFRKPGRHATWEAILEGSYLPPESLRPRVRRSLSKVIGRALAASPADRYPSAAVMAEALQEIHAIDLRTPRLLGEIVHIVASGQDRELLEAGEDSTTWERPRPLTLLPFSALRRARERSRS